MRNFVAVSLAFLYYVRMFIFNSTKKVLAHFALIFFCALQLCAEPLVKVGSKRGCPSVDSMAAEVESDGRSSWLAGKLDIVKTHKPKPELLYSGDFITDSEGFEWFVSRHYALKTDLPEAEAAEALLLLELAYPQLEAIFGTRPYLSESTRMAIVFGSSRNSLKKAMMDDDMHVFTLGGVMQEGYSCAYLYAGTPYQSRYILLHEAVHLFQYCISGNTRGCYGFFVEGIADFFSSHVYNPSKKLLTVNVADRAPIHNHLAKGLDEWHSRNAPSFSTLYEDANPSRGISVLLCAFLQSTPAFEAAWRKYCNGILTRGKCTSKARSDQLLNSLYGGAKALDGKFQKWVQGLEPSYRLLVREFDQEGDAIVSCYPASLKSPATMLLPFINSKAGNFICDWPPSSDYLCPDGVDAKLDIKWNEAPLPNSYARVAFVDSKGSSILDCLITNAPSSGLAFFEVNGVRSENFSFRRLPTRLREGVSLELCLSSAPAVSLLQGGNIITKVPIVPNIVADLKKSRPKIVASMADISFRLWEDEGCDDNNCRLPTGTRFNSSEETQFIQPSTPSNKGESISDWYLLGPLALPEEKLTNLKYNIRQFSGAMDDVFRLSDGSFSTWIKAPLNKTPLVLAPIVNLPRAFGRQANYSVAFARTTISSLSDSEATLVIGATDGVEAFVNGERVGETFVKREWTDGNSRFKIKLKRGNNEIILKLTHTVGVWLLNGCIEK